MSKDLAYQKNRIPRGNDVKKVAVIVTEYRFNSHADVILGRLLGDFDYHPQIEVVSLYLDQFPENDMSREEAARCGIPIYATIAEAISVGDTQLRIDGVIIIGEHGDYPDNEKRQKMYPRPRLTEETLKAMDALGLRVPIFLDKHMAYDFKDATRMYEQIKQRDIPFMGGSSIPLTDFVPHFERKLLQTAKEILVVSYSSAIEAYGFHGLEVLQCLAEKRAGGETGVAAIHTLEGAEVWAAMDAQEWPEDLLMEALATYPNLAADRERVREMVPEPVLFKVEYKDGTKGYVIQIANFVEQWGFAFCEKQGRITAARCDSELQRPFSHFARLTKCIEDMIITGEMPFPMERTYMTTGLIDLGMESLFQRKRLLTPELHIVY